MENKRVLDPCSGSTYIEAYATVFSALHKLDGKEGEGE